MHVPKRTFLLSLAAALVLCVLAAAVFAQEDEEDKAVTSVVEKLIAALNRADVDTATSCFMFPLIVLSVPEAADLPPDQVAFNNAEELRPELQRAGAATLELKDVRLVYRRGPVAAVTAAVLDDAVEVGKALFVLGKSPEQGWQIKLIMMPG